MSMYSELEEADITLMSTVEIRDSLLALRVELDQIWADFSTGSATDPVIAQLWRELESRAAHDVLVEVGLEAPADE